MKLEAKSIGLETGGKPVVILNKSNAEDIGIRSLGRVRITYKKKQLTCLVNTTTKIIENGFIGISEEVKRVLNLEDGNVVDIEVAKFPSSLQFIRNKLNGRKLSYEEMYEIVNDVVEGNLSEVEIASFVTALETRGLSIDEAASLSLAMVKTGERLEFKKTPICDKHSIGGVPGDKTTLLVVPIVATAGLTIPKTSSRAITSAAGTADKAECFMPVTLTVDEIKEVVRKTNGCIVWGGALHLAPADDIFIQVEYPLSIDPLLLPSIMSKKKAVGANALVIDIPCGRGSKVKTLGDANILAKDFVELGKRLGIKTRCAVTYGEQPVGYTIGPALEAKEALEVLMRRKTVPDLMDKAIDIASMIFELVGKKNPKKLAEDILNSGKAEKKLREIIAEQGGDEKVQPEDINIGKYKLDVYSKNSGVVLWINNVSFANLARFAGAPKDKGAGIVLYKKVGDNVKEKEKLFTVYAEAERKLEKIDKFLEMDSPMGIGDRMEMLIYEIKEAPIHEKIFLLER